MGRIIDLGNGYGRLGGYSSLCASLTFPLTIHRVREFYVKGYVDRNEYQQALLDMGYTEEEVAWFTALDSVTVAEWKARLPNARTV